MLSDEEIEKVDMLASQRGLFGVPRDICYLNSASYSPLPLRTQEAAREAEAAKKKAEQPKKP